MHRLLLAITASLAGLVLLPSVAGNGERAEIEKLRGSLLRRVDEVVKNQLAKGSNKFVVPTGGQQAAWKEVVTNVLKKRPRRARRIIKRHSFPYRIIRFTDDATKREYLLLEERPGSRGWGFYVFDTKTKNRLVIEVPHPVSDENTEREGIEAFLETGARAFLLAGAHRHTNPTLSACTQATARSNYAESDVAHNTETMFHQTHVVLAEMYPETVAVQLHGMRYRDVCPDVFLSSGTKDVTHNSKKLLTCLLRQEVEAELYDGRTTRCPLIARTNVQGRFSNGVRKDACNSYARTSPAPGFFIHVEQEPGIRENKRSWKKVIEALKCAFPY